MENSILEEGIITDNEAKEYAYGGFWIRVGATFIDGLALLPLIGLNVMAVYFWKQLSLMLLVNLVSVGYKPFMELKYGATLGKMALNLKVINREGGPISLKQTLLRSSPWFLNGAFSIFTIFQLMLLPTYEETEGYTQLAALQASISSVWFQSLVSVVFLLAVVWVAFQKEKRGLHDLLADTICIKTNKPV